MVKLKPEFKVGGIVTAAGLSKRMGAFKPLLPLGSATVIENTVKTLLDAGVKQVTVVTGYRKDEVESVLRKTFGERAAFVRNEHYRDTDMLYSIRLALNALQECDAFFLLPGDMPAVKAATLELLKTAMHKEEASIPHVIFPEYGGRRGHPPLIPAELIPDIIAFDGGGGLRGFWQRHKDRMRTVTVMDEGIMTDLDTLQDYDELKDRYTGS
ncbi:MAG: nucleotidyltransferase family protein [Lachnospiraceae bacterium]|nr:nucleotidyltransferase family protein [Lachnospiraceae bacterium]